MSLFESLYYESLIVANKSFLTLHKPLRMFFPHLEKELPSSKLNIDILIPAIEKDIYTLPLVIEAVRKHVFHKIDNIYIVSNSYDIRQLCSRLGCEYVDESKVLPIKKTDITYKVEDSDRTGWIFQQFIKLYSDYICQSDNILIIDADTVLIRPTIFAKDEKTIFYYSDEFNVTYYRTYEKIFQSKIKSFKSYVSHMMLLNKNVLIAFRKKIESLHGKNWYTAIFDSIEKEHMAPFSEFECYGNYFSLEFPDSRIEKYFHNLSLDINEMGSLENMEKQYCTHYRSLSFHVYPNAISPALKNKK